MTVTLAMLEEARDLAIQLKDIKEREMILRIKISKALNKDQTPGTANYDQDGMRVKLKVALNTSIDQEEIVRQRARLANFAAYFVWSGSGYRAKLYV